jgi:hypothetical protein
VRKGIGLTVPSIRRVESAVVVVVYVGLRHGNEM